MPDTKLLCLSGGCNKLRFQRSLLYALTIFLNSIDLCGRPRTDGLVQRCCDEMQSRSIVSSEAPPNLSFCNELLVSRAPFRLAVVMRAIASWKKSETLEGLQLARPY